MPLPTSFARRAALFAAGALLAWPLVSWSKFQGDICDPLPDKGDFARLTLTSVTVDGAALATDGGSVGTYFSLKNASTDADEARAYLYEPEVERARDHVRAVSLRRQP